MSSKFDKTGEALFRKYYNFTKNKINQEDVIKAREDRFKFDEYWKIWKEYGEFFGFVEGFFHKTDGINQLYKIPRPDREIFTSPKDILANFSSSDDLAKYFKENKILRMCNENAKNIYLACEKLLEKNHIPRPNSVEDLTKFRGYGRKIANMIMNLVFDIPRIAIDVHVFRSAIKYELIEDFGDLKSEKNKLIAENLLNEGFKNSIYHIEMDYLLFIDGKTSVTKNIRPVKTK